MPIIIESFLWHYLRFSDYRKYDNIVLDFDQYPNDEDYHHDCFQIKKENLCHIVFDFHEKELCHVDDLYPKDILKMIEFHTFLYFIAMI